MSIVRFLVKLIVVGVLGLIAACTTAPSQQSAPLAAGGSNLKVCSGMGVSNAPATTRDGRIVNYSPSFRIAGITLMRAPVSGCVSSGFGPRRGGASSFHKGVDLYTRSPAKIYAGGDGVIEDISTMRGFGRTILIRHNDRVKTRYAHLSSYASGLRVGDRVSAQARLLAGLAKAATPLRCTFIMKC